MRWPCHKAVFFATGTTPEGGTVGAAVKTRLYDGPATGQIVTVGEADLVDGETFTIKQDAAVTKVFEFDTAANGVAGGNVAVVVPAMSTANDVRDLIVTAVNGAGFDVKAVANGAGTVHLWNTTKGVAGNEAIAETVADAGFDVAGMTGGKAGGRDFTAEPWSFVRTYTMAGAPAKPDKGQVAHISARHDGWIEINNAWATTSKLTGGAAPTYDIGHWADPDNELVPTNEFGNLPVAGDKYVVCEGSRCWLSDLATTTDKMPAIVTVEEVLADSTFELLNKTDVQGVIDGTGSVKSRLDAKVPAGALTYKKLPNLFFGTRAGFASGHSAVAFNPGPTNLQPVNGKLYIPRQFGPRATAGAMAGKDLFEEDIKLKLGATVRFVDCWDPYHRLLGEVHCGSNVKRAVLGVDWWEKIP